MKGHWTVSVLASILILGSLGLSQQAFANPISFSTSDVPVCDPFPEGSDFGDELGWGPSSFPPAPFPPDEEILSAFEFDLEPSSCPTFASGPFVGTTISITNLTPTSWHDLIYVANADTSMSNFDGFVDGLLAFKIDNIGCDPGGINHPLAFGDFNGNCIFEPGETWEINIDDYFNSFGTPAENLNSLGLGFGTSPSSGSIIAFAEEGPPGGPVVGGTSIPIDTTALLIAGAQTTTPWLILGVLSAVGIGFAVFTLKRNH